MTQFRCLCTLKAFSLPLRCGRRRTTATFPQAMFKHGKKEPLLSAAHIFLIELSRLWDLRSTASDIRRRDCLRRALQWVNRLGIGTAQSRFLANRTQKPFAKSSRFQRSRAASFGQFPRSPRSFFSPFPIAALRLTKIAHEQFCTRRNERKFAAFFSYGGRDRRTALRAHFQGLPRQAE